MVSEGPAGGLPAQPAMATSPLPQARAIAIADARYYLRRAFRLIDEEARQVGLGPLECQLLVQLRGAPDGQLSVGELSRRVDVNQDHTSRLVRDLSGRGLVTKHRSEEDRRVTFVGVTEAGLHLVNLVDDRAQDGFTRLQNEFAPEQRRLALEVWARNLGVDQF